MALLDLPNEVLSLLPLHIDNIETFTNAASACRRLRGAFSHTRPETILRLAASSAPTFFSPHPHFLIAATARQASDWALGNENRTKLLREALQGGIDGLYEFCLEHSGLTLDDIRRTHLARFSIINPLADKIDKMAGLQWYQTPNFWDGGVSDAYTLDTEPDRAAFQIIIYGELFGKSMDAFLDPEKNLPYFDIHTRFDYITYCVPDTACGSYPGFQVLDTGPYKLRALPAKQRPRHLADGTYAQDQVALRHILQTGRWRRMWAAAIRSLLDDSESFTDEEVEDEDWRKKLYRNALQTQGLEGMQLVTLPKDQVSAHYLEKAQRTRHQIHALNGPPDHEMMGYYGFTPVSHAPDPLTEVEITIRSYNI
ncbi:uncharacterized protein N7459_009862 [Penicillium hispanicum]|uniref:uncharacterized protein n=1 Tax=Penicillium hispanicum TaxID=1080232 RepID=UPI0025411FEA|nr:uncharacterized protein N7459_009862 [Penicillium hispanicum]KAJ5570432.1 hypothetical protein N7459_009862 [Penicillium hispanicum]